MEKTNKQNYTYDYDQQGVRCRYSEDRGWEALEPSCLNCGYTEEECDCGEYEEALYVDEEEEGKDANQLAVERDESISSNQHP